jgi:hypothetical protein
MRLSILLKQQFLSPASRAGDHIHLLFGLAQHRRGIYSGRRAREEE